MAGEGMSNQLSNVLGVAIPYDLKRQLSIRSEKLGAENRTSNDIEYLANKSCWVRLVSSVRIKDIQYFKKYFPNLDITDGDSLAKKFILFAGTSEYTKNESKDRGFQYNIRSGFGANGSYGMLGNVETQLYGYRPMPGITDARIETQGKLGSIRSATINFKVWDKAQLDIIDALYFKLGYTMFLEWGHTTYFDNGTGIVSATPQLKRSDLQQIDPFAENLKKEIILREISTRIDQSNGNYDAMLGMCTNFNFSMNEDGGYDCSIKMIALGELASQIKINQPNALPKILNKEIRELVDIYTNILRERARQDRLAAELAAAQNSTQQAQLNPKQSINQTLIQADPSRYNNDPNIAKELIDEDSILPAKYKSSPAVELFYAQYPNYGGNIFMSPFPGAATNSEQQKKQLATQYEAAKKSDEKTNKDAYDRYADVLYDYTSTPPAGVAPLGKGLYSKRFGVYIPTIGVNMSKFISSITLDGALLKEAFSFFNTYNVNKNWLDADGNTVAKLDEDFLITNSSKIKYAYFSAAIYGNSKRKRTPLGLMIKIPDINFKDNQNAGLMTLRYVVDDFTKGEDKQIDVNKFLYSINSDKASRNIKILVSDTFTEVSGTEDVPETVSKGNRKNSVFTIHGTSKMPTNKTNDVQVVTGTQVVTQEVTTPSTVDIEWTLFFYDSSFIKDIQPAIGQGFLVTNPTPTAAAAPPPDPESQINLDADSIQAQEKLNYQSGLEVFVRAIQLHSFNKGYKDLEVKNGKIGVVDLYKEKKDFMKDLFENGVLSNVAIDFISNVKKYANLDEDDPRKLMERYASYGFNHNLMAQSKETQKANTIGDDPKIPQVKFKDLYTSYVVPYSINQGIAKDVDINYPVYIKLGFLLLALNHMCTIYDSPDGSTVSAKNQTPLVYIDFNTETNFCLSEPLQMSTDPLKILIPFRGSDDEYSKLFDPRLIENGKIKPVSGSSKELFKPQSQDYLSSQLPEFKGINRDDGDAYSGNIMNILLNTDYILSLCKNFANSDASQSVKLRPFLQQIIDDLNKYLGGINLFRLAYDDKSNCLYIVDDQVQPMKLNEKPIPNVGRVNSEIPVFGKYSIARSLEIRTDISSKLSNMIAISANSQIKSDSSKDGTPFGHFNENYTDRLIPQVVSINASNNTPNNGAIRNINDAELAAANAFNEYVKCALNTGQISDHNVSAATNYYIERMNKRKGEYPGTRASAMIPLSVNFSTDGISGLAIGHAFLLPKEVLPASYERESDSSSESVLGFVVTGLNHSLQNNTWITEVKANMMYLKDKRDFVAAEKTYNVKELSTGNFVIVQDDGNDTDILNIDPVGGSGVRGTDFKVNPSYKSLVAAAKASIGTSTASIPNTENGNLGCGAATSIIFLRATGKGIVPPGDLSLGTATISAHLSRDTANWRARSNWLDAKPGDVIVTERGTAPGHIGVVSDTTSADGSYTIISNSSAGFRGTSKGSIQPNYTVKKWSSVASRNPTRTFAYEYIGSFI